MVAWPLFSPLFHWPRAHSPPHSRAKSTLFDQVPEDVPRQLSPVLPARVTAADIVLLLGQAPNKQCSLDPCPTRLVKSLTIMPDIFAKMVNASLQSDIFPSIVLVAPALKTTPGPIHNQQLQTYLQSVVYFKITWACCGKTTYCLPRV